MDDDLKMLVHSASEEVLNDVIANPELDEEDLLVLLARRDLSGELLRKVARDPAKTRSYRVRLALLRHPRTPASATLSFVGQLHLFDLVAVSLLPHVPREIRAACEGSILQQLKQIPLGSKVTLARRTGSSVVLGRLLVDREPQVVEAVLTNPRLTEGLVVVALRDGGVPPHTVHLVSGNSRWSVRHDVRYALIRNRHTPLARALQFLNTMSREDIRTLARDPAVPTALRGYLAKATGGLSR